MDTVRGMSNRIRGVLSLILGVLCSVGLSLSLTAKADEENSQLVDLTNPLIAGVRSFYLSMRTSKVSLVLLAICLAVMIYKGSQIVLAKWENISLIAFSVLFAIMQLLAISLREIDSLYYFCGSGLNAIRSITHGLSLAYTCYIILRIVTELIRRHCLQKELVTSRSNIVGKIISIALFFVAWLPYFCLFYPGTANVDTVVQMMQSFKIPSYINMVTPIHPPEAYYTNHHPFLVTKLFEVFFRLGIEVFGDIRIGIAIYVLLHMLFLAAVFTAALEYMRRIGITPKRILFIRLVIMLLPIFPMYAICMVKDTLFAAFLLLFLMMMYEVARTGGEAFRSIPFHAGMILLIALIMLTKNYGIYIMLIIGIVYMIAYRKYILRIVLVFLPIIAIYQFVWISLLLPMWHVAPVGVQEALSVPIQQTARYVSEYPGEVTDEEREAIDAVLPYKKLAKKYDPMLSDPIKDKFRQGSTKAERKRYFKVWWQMFKKHPHVYIESILNNTYEYWDIDKISDLEYYDFSTYLINHDPDKAHTELYVIHNYNTGGERYGVHQLILMLEKVPIVNIFASLGLIPWLILYMILFNFFEGRGKYVFIYLIPVIIYAICMVGPDNGNSRYIMPVIFAMPYLIAMLFRPTD